MPKTPDEIAKALVSVVPVNDNQKAALIGGVWNGQGECPDLADPRPPMMRMEMQLRRYPDAEAYDAACVIDWRCACGFMLSTPRDSDAPECRKCGERMEATDEPRRD